MDFLSLDPPIADAFHAVPKAFRVVPEAALSFCNMGVAQKALLDNLVSK
jgi:hypothetical protein